MPRAIHRCESFYFHLGSNSISKLQFPIISLIRSCQRWNVWIRAYDTRLACVSPQKDYSLISSTNQQSYFKFDNFSSAITEKSQFSLQNWNHVIQEQPGIAQNNFVYFIATRSSTAVHRRIFGTYHIFLFSIFLNQIFLFRCSSIECSQKSCKHYQIDWEQRSVFQASKSQKYWDYTCLCSSACRNKIKIRKCQMNVTSNPKHMKHFRCFCIPNCWQDLEIILTSNCSDNVCKMRHSICLIFNVWSHTSFSAPHQINFKWIIGIWLFQIPNIFANAWTFLRWQGSQVTKKFSFCSGTYFIHSYKQIMVLPS